MKITADTNVLVRAVVGDDPAQSQAAIAALRGAGQIAVALPALCEFVWVLRRVYAFPVAEISAAIQALMAAGNVQLDRVAVEAGLPCLTAGASATYAAEAVALGQAAVADSAGAIVCQFIMVPNWLVAD